MFNGLTSFLSTFMEPAAQSSGDTAAKGAASAAVAPSSGGGGGAGGGGNEKQQPKKGKEKAKAIKADDDGDDADKGARKLREMVSCPVCQGEVRSKSINQHLEGCLGVRIHKKPYLIPK